MRSQASACVKFVCVCDAAATVLGDRLCAATHRAPPKSRQQKQVWDCKAGHRLVRQLRAVGQLVQFSQWWTAITGQQTCRPPASTAFIVRHPSGAPGVASPNGCQPTKAGRMPSKLVPQKHLVANVPGVQPDRGAESLPRCGAHRCHQHSKSRTLRVSGPRDRELERHHGDTPWTSTFRSRLATYIPCIRDAGTANNERRLPTSANSDQSGM